MAVSMFPNSYSYEADELYYVMSFFIVYMLLYCDTGGHIICNTLCFTWHLYFNFFIAYDKPVGAFDFIFYPLVIFAFLILQTILGMFIIHI